VSGPRFDEIEGEESHAAPRFDEIQEAEPPVTENGLRAPPRPRPPPADLNVVESQPRDPTMFGPTADAAVQGAMKGGSLDFADELAGVVGVGEHAFDRAKNWAAPTDPADISAQDAPTGPQPKSFADAYRLGRDKYRDLQAAVEKRDDSPGKIAGIGGELAGALAVPIPGPGKATGLVRAAKTIGTAAGFGGLFGLGHSNADVTKGEYSDAAKDAGMSALTSGGLAAGGVALGKGLSLAAGKAGQLVEKATGEANALSAKARDKAINSATGAMGSRTSEANRALEVIENLSKYGNPEEQQRAAEILASPEVAEMRRKILVNSSNRSGAAMSKIEEAEAALEKAKEMDPEALSKLSPMETAKRSIFPRVGRIAQRIIPAGVGAAVGNALGFPVAGTIAGGLVGAALGHSGTTMANLVKDPTVRMHGWSAVQKVLSGVDRAASSSAGQYLGKYAPVIASEIAQHGTEAGQAMHEALMEHDPGYAHDVAEQVAEGGQ
jgi:hypothetical protein